MTYQFALSDIGFRLIKAYEGFSPAGRLTRDGRQLVGYGQITDRQNGDVSEADAATALKADLETIENLVNTNVHAALTQSQFDALCSFAHSIGPEAFLRSEVLHALNKGEVITAASAIDAWRLGKIDGQIYVVDALVRRRTAEKALFLRPTNRTVPAPRQTLKAYEDAEGVVEKLAPLDQNGDQKGDQNWTRKPAQNSNIVTLYEEAGSETSEEVLQNVFDDEDITVIDARDETVELSETPTDVEYTSPIAEAAAEVSERLGALMEEEVDTSVEELPTSLVSTADDRYEEVVSFNGYVDGGFESGELSEADKAELLPAETAVVQEGKYASADKYIQPGVSDEKQNLWSFITMIIFGLTAAGAGLWASLKGSKDMMGEFGPLVSSAAVALGVLLFIMGTYYLMKQLFGRG